MSRPFECIDLFYLITPNINFLVLCRNKGVPFCFVHIKANLGKLVHLLIFIPQPANTSA